MKNALRMAFFAAALTIAPAADTPKNTIQTQKIDTPFLIDRKELPHMTKTLIEKWEDDNLNLTEGQRRELLKIRNRTIGEISRLTREISTIEDSVVKKIARGTEPVKLFPEINEISKLKAEVTKAHLRCIFDTSKVLTEEQMEYLFPNWIEDDRENGENKFSHRP